MGASSVWVLNKQVQFNNSVEIKLWDEDNPPSIPKISWDAMCSPAVVADRLPCLQRGRRQLDPRYPLIPAVPGRTLPGGTLPGGGTVPGGGVLPPVTLSPEQLVWGARLVGGFLVGASTTLTHPAP
jgi:hypothetical protein